MTIHRLSQPGSTDVILLCDDDARVDHEVAELMATALRSTPYASAIIADAMVGEKSRRRPGWSPTTTITDPAELTAIAVSDGFASDNPTSGGLVDRLRIARLLVEARAEVLHLPRPVVRVSEPQPLSVTETVELKALAAVVAPKAGLRFGNRPASFVLEAVEPRPAVTAVIPTAGAARLDGTPAVARAVTSVLAEMHDLDRVLLIVGDEFVGDLEALTSDERVRMVRRPTGPFNFSVAVNLGLLEAQSELVLLLNDDTETRDPGWLSQLAIHLLDPTVAACGALLLFPDGTIQHAGVILDDARPLHSFVGHGPHSLAHYHCDVAHDTLAVTGACMLVRRADALAVGGFSTDFPLSFNDIDFCLKLHRMGQRVVVEPAASLVHHESLSRSPIITSEEWDAYINRWGKVDDPWYHPAHHRPDDPDNLNLNADHLEPQSTPLFTVARNTRTQPRVHHGRVKATD